jgi:hypothetical protein
MSHRPWVIIAVFPGYKHKELWRTYHRSDAEAYVRFLKRSIPQGDFYVVFDWEERSSSD